MPRILVVEDEPPIQALIELYLTRDGHEVLTASGGIEALTLFEQHQDDIDLVVLDLMLPGLDGRGVCRRIRESSNVPVIMVTALDDPRDKLGGFDLGADDYVTKPFDPEELAARVRAILKRTIQAPAETAGPGLIVGNLVIDAEGHRASVGGLDLDLRLKEFELLVLLASNAGHVIPRDTLIERIWGYLDDDSRSLDVHISRLREKLARADATISIDTLRTVGYRLSLPR